MEDKAPFLDLPQYAPDNKTIQHLDNVRLSKSTNPYNVKSSYSKIMSQINEAKE